jgi:hypothetical protein
MSRADVRLAVLASPDRARSLFTVRAAISSAISSARLVPSPRRSALALMCSYCRSRFGLGVEGKLAGRLDELIAGAGSQAGQLEELRIRAASRVISHPSAPGPAAMDRAADRKELPGG